MSPLLPKEHMHLWNETLRELTEPISFVCTHVNKNMHEYLFPPPHTSLWLEDPALFLIFSLSISVFPPLLKPRLLKWQSLESSFWMLWFSLLCLHTYSFVLVRFPLLSQNTHGNQPWKRKDLPWFGLRGLDPQLVGSAVVRTVESQIIMAVVHGGAQQLTSKWPRRKDWVKDVLMRKWMGAWVERLIYASRYRLTSKNKRGT